jgi:hypothetical protein
MGFPGQKSGLTQQGSRRSIFPTRVSWYKPTYNVMDPEQIAHPRECVQSTKHPEGNTTATNTKQSLYYRDFPKSQWHNIHPTDNDSHANAGLLNSDVICYSNAILQVIASCIHLIEFFLSPPSNEHQRFTLYYKFANVIHSMVTGGPDVVNLYNFVDIFTSYFKIFIANE